MDASRESNDWEELQALVAEVAAAEAANRESLASRLLEALRPRVYQIVRSVCPDSELAQDITQEALLRLWQRLHTYNPAIAPFRSWLSRVVIHCAYNVLARQARLSRYELRETDQLLLAAKKTAPSALEQAPASEVEAVEQVAQRERLDRILALAQQTLSPDEYLVWLEQTVNGSSYAEIALLLERSESWARQTLLRARQKLAAAILLDPTLLSLAEIREAIRRCQHSQDPLTPQELQLLQACISEQARRPPPWRHTARFRRACAKLLNHLLD
ncbi:MAG: sigma-70 family RNA polymerase sigma factor [Fimbriimonadales bacterium]|nr:sigma-70 family RNA polymerase sigma factor [Fimbriimonadales bacterium]MDW8051698.1 sigma-70 family RNA polymerase sigma factor [Armatimonadota bacterium]